MPTRQVKAGQRRRPVTIQQKANKVSDGMGGYTSGWADVLKTRAAYREISAFEVFAQGQRQARYSCEYNIRRPGSIPIAPGMRLLDGARVMQIQDATDLDELHQELRLRCLELTGGQV
jgi:SPP1 family predicted phage head-tail adaptor